MSCLIRQMIDNGLSRFCLLVDLPNFYWEKFCSLGNASEDLSASAKFDSRRGEKHDRISSNTSFALYPLRACFPTEQSVGKASLFVKYQDMHLISISVLLRDRLCVLNLLIWRRLRKTSNHKLFLPWNLRYKRLRSRLCTCTYRYQLIIQRTFAGSIFIMAEFSTTSTHLVKDAQMFLGIVLITNQVSVE